MNQDNSLTSDRLALATRALEQMPVDSAPPQERILRAQQIPFSHEQKKTHRLGWIIAAMLILGLGCVAAFLLQHTADIAFADVVQSVNRTHTFTATVNLFSLDPPAHGFKYFVRDEDMRMETPTWVEIVNHKTGQFLALNSATHTASVEQNIPDAKIDLYQILRNYQGEAAQPLGDKKIDGHDTEGFRTVLNNDMDGTVIFWVDKATKLPIRVENGPVLMTDLHFDVPLSDALFDTSVPAGYTIAKVFKGDRFQFAGQVIDQQGNPISNVKVQPTERDININSRAMAYLGPAAQTDKSGHFTIDCSTRGRSENPIRLEFTHPDFLYARLEDMRLVSPEMRNHLQVRLNPGSSVAGQVVDDAGRPVADAVIQSICDHVGADDYGNMTVQADYAKSTATDDQGGFVLHGLPATKIVLQVRKGGSGPVLLTAQADIDLMPSTTKPSKIQITAKPLELAPGTQIHELFGMKLVDVDPSLRDRLSSSIWDTVLVLDPGASVSRLNVGALDAGDMFWMANSTRIKNFQEFAQQLLATCEAQQKQGRTEFDVRVVYDFTNPDGGGSNTQYMHLNGSDLAELRRVMRP